MKVIYRKLGKEKAFGQATMDKNTIEVDSRLKGRKRMEILIHEALHLLNWEWSESKVSEQASRLAKLLWEQHYRHVDLSTRTRIKKR